MPRLRMGAWMSPWTCRRSWGQRVGRARTPSSFSPAVTRLASTTRSRAAAQHVQSSGAHPCVPALATTAVGLRGTAFLAPTLMIGPALVLRGLARGRSDSGPSYIDVVAALLTIQHVCFIGQEVAEA